MDETVTPEPRTFSHLPKLFVPKDFDDPLPETELAEWGGAEDR